MSDKQAEKLMRDFGEKIVAVVNAEPDDTPVAGVLLGISVGMLVQGGYDDKHIYAAVKGAIAKSRELKLKSDN